MIMTSNTTKRGAIVYVAHNRTAYGITGVAYQNAQSITFTAV